MTPQELKEAMGRVKAPTPAPQNAAERNAHAAYAALRKAVARIGVIDALNEPRIFKVSFRVTEDSSQLEKGPADFRRAALDAMFDLLKPEEQHIGTSTHIVISRLDIDALRDFLAAVLVAGPDYLDLAQVARRSTFGHPTVQP